MDEETGAEWRVWPESEPITAGTVHEAGSYIFELRDSDAAADARVRPRLHAGVGRRDSMPER
jgi:hypothetical protein